ncbi:MAG: D-glycero-beta-D-manno-heptose-7-phosphate kinase [Deltaproteobacteria bacterium]|nr:D-glycero-beta-D-manno-heptose-7-phosphate kinase [Deltaproteobacteria bacterium]MBW2123444.1 D-glycero-beta-D-manno-heptose-7-phosphate kinase [Deltaproteobacteria bacterium]
MSRHVLGLSETEPLFDRFSEGRVLVVGDIILDEFIWGKVDRISPEAPVPVVTVEKETQLLGGAANVVNNIRSLGGQVFFAGLVGGDERGRKILSLLEESGVDTGGVLIDPRRPTTGKTRIVAHNQQVVRFDRESQAPLSQGYADSLIAYVREAMHSADTVVVADYGKGVVTGELIRAVTEISKNEEKIVALDPKMGRFDLYRDVTIVTPNSQEASVAAGREIRDESSLMEVGHSLLDRFNCKAVLITRGEDGMALFERGGEAILIPTTAREVFDVTGAGDSVIGVMALALAVGASFPQAAMISNFAAGVVVGKVGTATVTLKELRAAVKEAKRNEDGS